MKQYQPTDVITNSSSSSQQSSNSSRPYSNSMIQELMKNGEFAPNTSSNSDMIQLLESADQVTDIAGLTGNASINGVNAGINGVKGYQESPCTTTTGKVLDGSIDAALNLVIGSNIISNISDMLLPEGYKIGELTDSASSALTSTLESVITGDETAMLNYQQKVESGEYGEVVQKAPEIEDYWEENGFSGGMSNLVDEILDLVQ